MELKFTVKAIIERPVDEVFDAVYNSEKLSNYFTTGSAKGNMDEGKTVTWDFADFPGEFPVEVKKCEKNSLITFEWGSSDKSGNNNTVTLEFKILESNRTQVIITESGWEENEKGLEASYGNCYGWTQMLCAMKVWIEHGINLREGFFK